MKRLSPFGKDFWIKRGLTEKEAEYKRNSIRPIRKEFWLEKGFTEEEAIKKALQIKKENDTKGGKTNSDKPKKEHYKNSVRRKEYWISKGFTEKEANQKVKEIQITFSLEKCIEKYGEEEGLKRWQERQDKWQNTLKSKTTEEQYQINLRKKSISLDNFSSKEKCIEELKRVRNIDVVSNLEQLEQKIINDFKKYPNKQYMPIDKYLKSFIQKVQLQILEIDEKDFINQFKSLFIKSKYLNKKGNKQAYRMWVGSRILRSSYEIYFYEKFPFKDKLIIDEKYPNSNLRYDFYYTENKEYIEICPMYNLDKKYKQKMDKKKKLFHCIILKNCEDIDKYIKGIN